MNDRTTLQSVRRRIDIVMIYRAAVCIFACLLLFTAGAMKLSMHFAPENLEELTLGNSLSLVIPPTLREDESMDGIDEGVLKQEIYTVESPKPPAAEKSAEGIYPITEIDMSSGAGAGEVLIRDSDSGKSVDIKSLLYAPYPKALSGGGFSNLSTADTPLVLIYHTHATECYTPDGACSYGADTSFRSTDSTENMVAIGAVMTEKLNSMGVPAIHCQTLHDAEDYNASYVNSLASVKEYLKQYPSIKYVFDVHRDAIIKENGEAYKPTCTLNGIKTAQTMTLVGTDAGGADHPYWQTNNMNLAIKLQNLLTSEYNGMARPINTRNASFNQQYAPGSLLFEVGSCANTLAEAKIAAENLATAIGEVILGNN